MLSEVKPLDPLYLLLVEFKDLFVEPTTLPPQRPFDHAINLKTNTEPINVCSSRYPPIQKAEIEKLVKEMLVSSIIQPSYIPFASPVLLIKKRIEHGDFALTINNLMPLLSRINFPYQLLKNLKDLPFFLNST